MSPSHRRPRAGVEHQAAPGHVEPAPASPVPATGPGRPASPAAAVPILRAGTGLPIAGGSAGAPLPSLTRQPSPATATRPSAGLAGRTPGTALPRGAGLSEPWPKHLETGSVLAAPLETGLSDYAFWAEYLAAFEPAPPPDDGFRRGRVWR
jgi:cyanobactin cluster PatC/TenC/TruC protein